MTPIDLLFSPRNPLRPVAIKLARRQRLGSLGFRIRVGAVERPHYAYCVHHSARLARKLGYDRISVAEFGVAGGNGLILLESYALEASKESGVEIDVYGFDTGQGLPEPVDYRDLPYQWRLGFFRMDEEQLSRRLRGARLVLGNIKERAATFFEEYHPAPLAAVVHDLDFYSSTCDALRMFEGDESQHLPRVFCYFDDIIGGETELFSDFTGERLAIAEFNERNKMKKLSPAYHLVTRKDVDQWFYQIYILHDFEHGKYNMFVSDDDQQLPLGRSS